MRLWSSTTSVMLIRFGLAVLHSALSTNEHAGLKIQQHLFVWYTFELSKSQLPYWFRPIESGQLGFWNLTSHFIFIQIFQRDFSTLPLILTVSNYYTYICWGQNEYLLKIAVASKAQYSFIIAILVKAQWEWSIGISELYFSFYLRPNISDIFLNLAPHFIRIQIFQMDFLKTKWTFLDF